MRLLALALIVLLPVAAGAGERVPTFPKRTDYDQARSSLLSLGWAPVAQTAQRCDSTGCYARCSIGFEERCKAYPEAETCRGTGRASCDMIWKRRDTLIEIITGGEDDPPMVIGAKCRANC